MIKKIFNLIVKFISKLDEDHIGAYSAQSAFFFIMSIFPLSMLLLAIIKYTPLTVDTLIGFINELLPSTLANSFNNIINETYSKSNFALISIVAITTLWTASKAFFSIISGFDTIYEDKKEKRGYFKLRFLSSIYTVIFIFSILLTLTLLVFGNKLLNFFGSQSYLMYQITKLLLKIRGIYVPIILILIFSGVYKLAAPKSESLKAQLPGAIFSSFGWTLFSYAFSIYVDDFGNYSYIYGSITTIILLMVWIYFCIYIMFIGLEINIFFKKYFIKMKEKITKTPPAQ